MKPASKVSTPRAQSPETPPAVRLLIAAFDGVSLRRVLKTVREEPFRWAYVGPHVARSVALSQRLAPHGERVDLSALFHTTVAELKGVYVDYIGSLGPERASLDWWLGWLSEKNVYVSKTFLHACYVKTCLKLLQDSVSEPRLLVLIIENPAVRRCLLRNLPPQKLHSVHVVEPRWRRHLLVLRDVAEMVARRGFFLLNGLYHITVAKYLYGSYRRSVLKGSRRRSDPLTLFVTWVDSRSFPQDGGYIDAYLGDAARYARQRGDNVATVPVVLRRLPYGRALASMKASGESFLPPHAFLTVVDLLRATALTTFGQEWHTPFPPFASLDISDLIWEDQHREWASQRP
ncbi:MAG: hypothetical protein ACE5JL_01605, partial [Dehalococcoidia bacterium]